MKVEDVPDGELFVVSSHDSPVITDVRYHAFLKFPCVGRLIPTLVVGCHTETPGRVTHRVGEHFDFMLGCEVALLEPDTEEAA